MKNKGFTIIELLMVIAIIAILTSIVLVSIVSARNKAMDKAIQANMLTIRNQAQLYVDGAVGAGYYGPVQAIPYSNNCSIGVYTDAVVVKAVERMQLDRGIDYVACFSSPKTFAIVSKLKHTNDYFCLDSVTNGKVVLNNDAPNGLYGQGVGGVIDSNTALCN